MEQLTILQLLDSPIFWFSTVIIGIVVGMIGNFSTDTLKKILARFSETQRKKSDEQERAFKLEVQDLLDNPSKVIDLKIEAIYILLSNVFKLLFYLLATNLLFGMQHLGMLGITINFLISVLAVVTSLSVIKNHIHIREVLKAYKLSK